MSYFQKAALVIAVILWWQVAIEIANYNTAKNDYSDDCTETSAYIITDSGDIHHLTTCELKVYDEKENDDDDSVRAALIEATRHHHDG